MQAQEDSELIQDENERALRLLAAQSKAVQLFAAIAAGDLIRPGVRESAVSNASKEIAADMLGVTRY